MRPFRNNFLNDNNTKINCDFELLHVINIFEDKIGDVNLLRKRVLYINVRMYF